MEKIMSEDKVYDIVVIGLGPSGVASSIYGARKGLKVGAIGKVVGGQMLETNGIENIIGVPKTTGFEYSKELEKHLLEYDLDLYKKSDVIKIENDTLKKIYTEDGKVFQTKTIILSTGAKYRKLNIIGEDDFIGKGVHYCSTCDGPFYRNLDVVVVGGGNSGVEAVLDLSNIAKKVTLVEFMPELKADKILQEKLKEKDNIEILLNTMCKEVKGEQFVTELIYQNRETQTEQSLKIDGLFVEIGHIANTDFIKPLINTNNINEIIIDENNMTNVDGIFAAGDCTTVKHKQIIIAMGEGAKAALSAFNYLINQ